MHRDAVSGFSSNVCKNKSAFTEKGNLKYKDFNFTK